MGAPEIPLRLRITGLVLRALFIGILLAVTLRVSSPQTETIWSAYETPGDLIRVALGLVACLWILFHLFEMPQDVEAHRTWIYLGLVAVPLRPDMRDRYLVNGAVNKLTAHRPRAFAHIVFESGEHVLVSCKQSGIRISRLWLGVVPIRKVCDWPRSSPKLLDDALKFFMAGPDSELPGGTILELIASRIMRECRSIADVKRMCRSLRPAR